jgi:uncharacterized repeat protein (TIGR01451 family)
VNPITGTLPISSSQEVVVTFDSTGLSVGVYTGTLCVNSNDPISPLVTVPLTLTVIEEVNADLAIDKTAPISVTLGDTFTYTLDVSNLGPATALATTVTDTLPTGVTFVSASAGCAEAGGIVTCDLGDLAPGSMVLEIVVTADEAGTLTNTATVSSASPDPDGSNNSDSTDTDVITPGAEADLSLTKSATVTATVGDTITYTVDVSNAGPDTALSATVMDTLPGEVTFVSASAGCAEVGGIVTCDLGDLAPGNATVEIVVTADVTGTVSNTATVSSTVPDPDTGNNSDTATTDVIAAPPPTFEIYLPIVIQEGSTSLNSGGRQHAQAGWVPLIALAPVAVASVGFRLHRRNRQKA